MAKFTPGAIAGQISGSIGGWTFSHSRYGPYIRRRAVPITSTTPAALKAKADFAAGSTAWQALAAATKLAWNSWAIVNPITNSLGQAQTLTGHSAFTGLFARAIKFALTPLTLPPLAPAPAPLTSLAQTCDIGPGAFELTFSTTPLPANESLWIDAAVVDSAGINYVQNLLRHVRLSPAAQASPDDHQNAIQNKFGTLAVDQIVHVSVSIFSHDTYLKSPPLRVSTIVVDTT